MDSLGSSSFFVAVDSVPNTITEIRDLFKPLDAVEDRLLQDTFEQTPIKLTPEILPQVIDMIVSDEGCPFEELAKNKRLKTLYKRRPPVNNKAEYLKWRDQFEQLSFQIHKEFLRPWLEARIGKYLLRYRYSCETGDCVACVLEQGDHWANVDHLCYPHH